MKPERLFFVMSVVFGVLLAFVTPPFQVPDEAFHFYRAYSITQGGFRAEQDDGRTGDELPVSIITASNRFSRQLAGKPQARTSLSEVLSELDRPLRPEQRYFEHFPASATYPPYAYLPQVAAMALTSTADGSPTEILYAGRLSNLFTTSILIYLAIALAPVLRWHLALVALLPMTMFLRASASADGVTTGLVFLAIAAVLRLAFGEEGAKSRKALAALLAASILLPLTKAVYAATATSVLMVPRRKGGRTEVVYASVFAAVAVGMLMAMPWVSTFGQGSVPGAGIDPPAQIAAIQSEPLRAAGVVARDLVAHAPRYLAHLIGRLGTLDTPLPLPLLAAYALALASLLVISDASPSTLQRTIAGAIFLGLVLALSVAMYVLWTPVGATSVEGIQGRYFIPFAPLLFVVTANRRFEDLFQRRWFPRAFAVFTGAGLAVTLCTLAERYYA